MKRFHSIDRKLVLEGYNCCWYIVANRQNLLSLVLDDGGMHFANASKAINTVFVSCARNKLRGAIKSFRRTRTRQDLAAIEIAQSKMFSSSNTYLPMMPISESKSRHNLFSYPFEMSLRCPRAFAA